MVRPIHLVWETVLHVDILELVESYQNMAAWVEGLVHMGQRVVGHNLVAVEEAAPIGLVVVHRSLHEVVDILLLVERHNFEVVVVGVEDRLPGVDRLLEAVLDCIDQEGDREAKRSLTEENLHFMSDLTDLAGETNLRLGGGPPYGPG